ncbi:hypothetical protein PMAYCL1PPCAC_04450, partial [Pristionchus mayeri]
GRIPAIVGFPTLLPSLDSFTDKAEDDDIKNLTNTRSQEPPTFERFNFRHSSEMGGKRVSSRQPGPIPVAKMPRIRMSDGRYMRPPLTLKNARALATYKRRCD